MRRRKIGGMSLREKSVLLLAVILLPVATMMGCAASQDLIGLYRDIKAMQTASDGKIGAAIEKANDVADKVLEANKKLDEMITKADSGEDPAAAAGVKTDPVADGISKAGKGLAPLLPPPFNIIVGALATLLPVGTAWLKAKTREKKRTIEEVLLIKSLQLYKKEDPEGFKNFIAIRDRAAKGLLTVKEIGEALEGINALRAIHA